MSKPSKPTTRAAASEDCMNLRSSTKVLKTPTPTNKPPPGHIKNIDSVIKSKSRDITPYLEKAKSSVIKEKEHDKVEHQLVENPDPQVEENIDMIEKNWDEVIGEEVQVQTDEDDMDKSQEENKEDDLGEYALSKIYLEKANQYGYSDFDCQNTLASILIHEGKLDEAEQILNGISDVPESFFNLGVVSLKRNDMKKAKEFFNEYENTAEDFRVIYIEYARTFDNYN